MQEEQNSRKDLENCYVELRKEEPAFKTVKSRTHGRRGRKLLCFSLERRPSTLPKLLFVPIKLSS